MNKAVSGCHYNFLPRTFQAAHLLDYGAKDVFVVVIIIICAVVSSPIYLLPQLLKVLQQLRELRRVRFNLSRLMY